MNHLTTHQVAQLLAPIRPTRVLKDPRNNSHVSQQDVTAHLIRVFGFGNFDTEILSMDCVFETPRDPDGKKWDVCYRAAMRLTVKNPDGSVLASYEDTSCGDAQNQNRQDAHDLALKSAVSTAKKRCAIHLGDQFGLSLYNKGQMAALVGGTLVDPRREDVVVTTGAGQTITEGPGDIQEGVPQQVSMGHDETDTTAEATDEQVKVLEKTLGAKKVEE